MNIKIKRKIELKKTYLYKYTNVFKFVLPGDIINFNKLIIYKNKYNIKSQKNLIIKRRIIKNKIYLDLLSFINKNIYKQKIFLKSPLIKIIKIQPKYIYNKSINYYLKFQK